MDYYGLLLVFTRCWTTLNGWEQKQKVVLADWRTWIVSNAAIIGSWAYWMSSDGVSGKGGGRPWNRSSYCRDIRLFSRLRKVIIVLRTV